MRFELLTYAEGLRRIRGELPAIQPDIPREIVVLAYAIDAALLLPETVFGWRARLRAVSLRDELDELVPRQPVERWRQPEPDTETWIGPEQLPERREPELPELPELVPVMAPRVDTVERSAVARARQLTRGVGDKRARELAVRAVVAGWQLRRSNSGGHWLLSLGECRLTLMHDYGDMRSWLNLRSQAKRYGLDVEGL